MNLLDLPIIAAVFIGFVPLNSSSVAAPRSAGESPGQNAIVTIPQPENIALPKSLSGFVSVRLNRITPIFGNVWNAAPERADFDRMVRLEGVCGLSASDVGTLCFASRASDSAGMMLVSGREKLSLEKVAGNLALPAGKISALGSWRQVTLKMAGQPSLLAVLAGPNDLFLLYTDKPHLETAAGIGSLMKDLASMRSAVAAGPAMVWGRIAKLPAESPFAAGTLPNLDKLVQSGSPLHFDMRWNDALDIRFAAGGELGSSSDLAVRAKTVFSSPGAQSLKNPPQWQGLQSGTSFLGSAVLPAGFFIEMLEASRKWTKTAKAKRDAQTLAAMCNAARSAGCTHFDGVTDIGEIARLLLDGVTPSQGPFAGQTFKVSSLNPDELTAARRWLELKEDALTYTGGVDLKGSSGEGADSLFDLAGQTLTTLKPSSVATALRSSAAELAALFGTAKAVRSPEVMKAKTVAEVVALFEKGVRLFDSEPIQCGPFAPAEKRLLNHYLRLRPGESLEFDDHGENLLTRRRDFRLDPDSASRSTAMELVSSYLAARSSGALQNLRDVDSIIKALATGVSGAGAFSSHSFRVPLEADEAAAAARHLQFRDGCLDYVPAPITSPR